MSKSKKPVRRKEVETVETKPDGWDRFTKAVNRMAPPKPHKPKPKKPKPK